MKIEYMSQDAKEHIVIDKVIISKNKKGFFTCQFVQNVFDEKKLNSKEIEHSKTKGFSRAEAFLSALNKLGNEEEKD